MNKLKTLTLKIANVSRDLEILRDLVYEHDIEPGDWPSSDKMNQLLAELITLKWGGFTNIDTLFEELSRPQPRTPLIEIAKSVLGGDLGNVRVEDLGPHISSFLINSLGKSGNDAARFLELNKELDQPFLIKLMRMCQKYGWVRNKPDSSEEVWLTIMGLAYNSSTETLTFIKNRLGRLGEIFMSLCGISDLETTPFSSSGANEPNYGGMNLDVIDLYNILSHSAIANVYERIGGKIQVFNRIKDPSVCEVARVDFDTGLSLSFQIGAFDHLSILRDNDEYLDYYCNTVYPQFVNNNFEWNIPHPVQYFSELEDSFDPDSEETYYELILAWERLVVVVSHRGTPLYTSRT